MPIYRRPEDDPKFGTKPSPRAIRLQQYPGGGLTGTGSGGGGSLGSSSIGVEDDEQNTTVPNVSTLQFEADTFVVSTPGAGIAKVDLTNVILADGTVPFTGNQSMGNFNLTNVADPTSDQEAATKFYVDNAIQQSRDYKDSVRVATTTAGTLASSFENGDTIDGVVLATGDRILIKDQVAGDTNGIYTVNASGAPTRATDADTSGEVTPGMVVPVEEGTANADKLFMLTTTGPINLGTTSLQFSPFGVAGSPSGAAGGVLDGTYPNPGLAAGVAGAGLTETSDVLSVNVDNSTIEINSDTLRVKDAGITNAKLANMAEARIKGRASGAGTGVPQDLTGTQATAILDNFIGDTGSGGTKGLVPAPSAGDAAALKFLKSDGSWSAVTATPSGAAGGVLDGSYPNPGLAASVAGDGLAETSNVLSVNVDNTTIEISGDALQVKAGGIGPTQLASTSVAAGTYTNTTLTVDSDGRITSASNGTGTATPTGAAGGVLDGMYPNPGLAASVAGAGLTETTNVLSVNVDDATIEINSDTLRVKAGGIGANELASTTVTPGSYTNADITVDADGRITAAASGVGGGGTGPAVKANYSGTQAITNNTETYVNFSGTPFDTRGDQHFNSSANLTGTVAKSSGSATLTGTGTQFLTELAVGQMIIVPGTDDEKRIVTAIASDTSLTVHSAFTNNASGQTARRWNAALVCQEAGIYQISCTIQFESGSGARVVNIYQNRHSPFIFTAIIGCVTQDATSSSIGTVMNCSFLHQLDELDFVEVMVYHLHGSDRNIESVNGYSPTIEWHKVCDV